MVYVKVTFKVAIRTSQRLVVVLMIYFIFSNDLHALIHSTRVNFVSRIESDHIPLTFRVIFPKENVCSDEVSQHEQNN